MAWPSKIYCATKTLGVYYASDFSDPTVQPTWATINTGLPATDVRQFALDPFTPDTKQYCLLEATRTLYRRDNGGSWTSIFTKAQAMALTSADYDGSIKMFWADKLTAGRVWVLWNGTYPDALPGQSIYVMYSDDWGANWISQFITGAWMAPRNAYDFEVYGDTVFVRADNGSNFYYYISANKMATKITGGDPWWGVGGINQLQPTKIHYSDYDYQHNTVDTSGTVLHIAGPGPSQSDVMWFAAANADHQRIISGDKVYATNDSWATVNTPSAITPAPVAIAPWSGMDEDQMIVGLQLNTPPWNQPHVIGCLYGESDVTATGIAGANCDTTPFADSIPDTCGGLALGGVAAVFSNPTGQPVPPDDETITPPGGGAVPLGGTANVQAVTMPGYTGDARGEPLPGDRSAWLVDTEPHADLHAQDIQDEEGKYHLPVRAAANGNAPVFNSTTGLYENADVLTPTEHTAIGDGAPHHALVTLDALTHSMVTLAGQVLKVPASSNPGAAAAILASAPTTGLLTLAQLQSSHVNIVGAHATSFVALRLENTLDTGGSARNWSINLGANAYSGYLMIGGEGFGATNDFDLALVRGASITLGSGRLFQISGGGGITAYENVYVGVYTNSGTYLSLAGGYASGYIQFLTQYWEEAGRIVAGGKWGFGTTTPTHVVETKGKGNYSAAVFTGTGLNNAHSGGTYIGEETAGTTYTVIIDSEGTPDTYKWRKGAGAWTTGVPMVTWDWHPLGEGIAIAFATDTGHTLNDQWVITCTVVNPMRALTAAGNAALTVGNDKSATVTGAFGCNGASPQAAYSSGGLLAGVVAALVANGILSD